MMKLEVLKNLVNKLQDKMASDTLRVKSVVRGYHVYKDNWISKVGDKFEVKIEEMNCYDRYASALSSHSKRRDRGHVPREFSKPVYYFIKNNGCVTGEVCGRRKLSNIYMKGLEIPCVYEFFSVKKNIKKLTKILKEVDYLYLL